MLPIPGETKETSVPKILEGAKLAFVLALRKAFSSSLTDENLRYDADKGKTKIKVFTAYPLRMEFLPALVVSVGGGDASVKYLADDFVEEDVAAATVRYAGQINFNVSVTILSRSTLERERIMDHLIFFIRHLFIGDFRRAQSPKFNFDLLYSRDIRVGAENISESENKPLYEQTIDLPCYMEYHAEIDQGTLETLRAVKIDIQAISMAEIGQE